MAFPAAPVRGAMDWFGWGRAVHDAVTITARVPAPTGTAATDTANIQGALNEVGSAGGGEVELARGDYKITPNSLAFNHSDVALLGQGGHATRLVKAAAGRLLDISGTGEADAQMRMRCRLADVGLVGAGLAGDLLRSYYSQFIIGSRVLFEDNNGSGLNAVQCWDSLFERCRWDYVHGNSNGGDGLGAAVWLKASDQGATTGQFGYSYSDCDNVHFDHCTWEQNIGYEVWMDGRKSNGTYGAERINECTFSGRTKMENATGLKTKPFVRIEHGYEISFQDLQISNGTHNAAAQPAAINWVELVDVIDVSLGRYRPEMIASATTSSSCRTALSVQAGTSWLRGDVLGSAQTANKPSVALVEYTGTGRTNNSITAAYSYNPGNATVLSGTANG